MKSPRARFSKLGDPEEDDDGLPELLVLIGLVYMILFLFFIITKVGGY